MVPDKTFHKKNTEKEQRVEWWLPGVREGGDGRIGDMLFTGANVQRLRSADLMHAYRLQSPACIVNLRVAKRLDCICSQHTHRINSKSVA